MPLTKITIGRKETGDEITVSSMALGSVEIIEFYKYLPKSRSAIIDIATAVVLEAYKCGINCFDTADMYAVGIHEMILGYALKEIIEKNGRDKVVITSKVGIVRDLKTAEFQGIDCSFEYIKSQCQKSLEHLGVSYLDIYYLHRPDNKTPIEQSIDALIELKREGKIKHFGLSEFPPELIEKAQQHAMKKGCSISAIQNGYSILNRKIEIDNTIVICQKYSITIFAHSPFASGLATNTSDLKEAADAVNDNSNGIRDMKKVYKTGDQRRAFFEFNESNIVESKKAADELDNLTKDADCTRAQFSLAFIQKSAQKLNIVIIPIIGTKTPTHIAENVVAYEKPLTDAQYDKACQIFSIYTLKNAGKVDFDKLKEAFAACPKRLGGKRNMWPPSAVTIFFKQLAPGGETASQSAILETQRTLSQPLL